jgi:hypothetical protein
MKHTSKWNVRQMECPEGKGLAELLLEWKVEKGKKILCSVSCDSPQLTDYSGVECRWCCLEKLSAQKR